MIKRVSKWSKEKREAAGLTQREASNALKLTTGQYISNVERGLCSLSPKHFNPLAKLYKAPVGELVKAAEKDFADGLLAKVNRGS